MLNDWGTALAWRTQRYGDMGDTRHQNHQQLDTDRLFVDDCALFTHIEEALQHIVNHFSDAAKNFSLTISLKNQPPPPEADGPPQISIDGTNLNTVEHFTYQSARILTTSCPKPVVSLEDCQREYGRNTCSASP